MCSELVTASDELFSFILPLPLIFFFLRIKVCGHKKLFCSYPLTAGLGVICFHVKILICFCKIRPSLAMQIKRVSVFRQGKLCRKAFQTEQIFFRDSPAICAYNAWFCPEHCSSDFRRGFSVRTSALENLVGNQWETMGIYCLAPCLLQPSSPSPTSTASIQPLGASLLSAVWRYPQKWWCISTWAEKISWLHKQQPNADRNVKTHYCLVNSHWIGQRGDGSAPDQFKPGCLSSGRGPWVCN